MFGNKIANNTDVSRGAAKRAIIFTIYLQGAMEDFQAINYLGRIPYRGAILRNGNNNLNAHTTISNTQPRTKTRNKYERYRTHRERKKTRQDTSTYNHTSTPKKYKQQRNKQRI